MATLPEVAYEVRQRAPDTRVQFRPSRIFLYLLVLLFLFMVLAPFYWIAKSALSNSSQVFTVPPTYLPRLTTENFVTLANQIPLFEYTRNSILVSTGTAFLSVVFSFLAAYAFARLEVPGRNFLLWLFVLTMALPEIATIIPLYRLMSQAKLLDTIHGLVLVMSSVLTPFTVWVLVAFIQQVPYEIEEAAIIDGANLPTRLIRIVFPLTRPAIVTMLVINFINGWNNLLYPLTFSVSDKSKTLSVAITEIYQVAGPWGPPWELISALGVTLVLPTIILVLVSQQAIVRGLTRGAIK
jgi:ABC-type glycerol-3-phosphate transport system permease component